MEAESYPPMSNSGAEPSLFETLLPNETLFRILRFLDPGSLVCAAGVNTVWRNLANREKLWYSHCRKSGRVTGEFTQLECNEYARLYGWRRTYFWIASEDLVSFATEKDFTEAVCKVIRDARKRRYWHARGLELFPSSVSLLQQYADYLVDRPDQDGTWDRARTYYERCMATAKQSFERLLQRRKRQRQERQERLRQQAEQRSHAAGEDTDGEDTDGEEQTADDTAERNELRKAIDEARRTYIYAIYRYVFFLANNRQNVAEADKHFLMLFELLPRNPWVIEQYAEFCAEYLLKHKLAERLHRLVLQMSPTGSSLANYALFLWRVRGSTAVAERCFQLAAELDPDRYYYYANFMSRRLRASPDALYKTLTDSKLCKLVEESPDDDHHTFSLALAYHQITDHEPSARAAEMLYTKHLELARAKNHLTSCICTLSNLAELMLHARLDFDTAERLYGEGLELAGGANETIQMAMAGLRLARGDVEAGLPHLKSLLQSSYIQAARNTHTEGLIMYYIYCPPHEKVEALRNVKHALLTRHVRPKLILMFDAHLAYARQHDFDDLEWIEVLCSVYNCEDTIDVLDPWEAWLMSDAPEPPVDNSGTDLDLQRLGLEAMDQ